MWVDNAIVGRFNRKRLALGHGKEHSRFRSALDGRGPMSIYELVNEIDNEDIVLPAIQRDFVWDEERIELLFDSMFRGYPVGIVLLWETYTPIQFRSFARNHVPGGIYEFEENKKGKRLKLVLDGQQRLSSIYVALKGTFNGQKLYYDILSGRDSDDHSEVKYRFMFTDDAEAKTLNREQIAERKSGAAAKHEGKSEAAYWIRLSEVIGRNPRDIQKLRDDLAQQLRLSNEDKLRMELNIQTAGYALSENSEILKTQTIDSKLPANDEKRKSAFDILEIFVRVNTQGMILRRSDLIVSMLRLYWAEASVLLPRFVKEINDAGNLNIDNDFIIRSMFSTAGIGTRLDFELLRKKSNVDKIQNTYRDCFDAIRSTIDFVRAECGIDSARLLGGISTMVPFVHYLFHAPKHTFPKGVKADARRALFLFAFAKTFTQHSESRTGAFVRDYLPAPKDIAQGSPLPFNGAAEYVSWRANFDLAEDRLFGNNVDLALALIQRRTGGRIQLSENLPEIDHIFPRSVLEEKGIEPQEIHDLGNLWILPRGMNRNKSAKHPHEYLSDVDDTALRTAMIDRNLLDYRSYRTFIRNRRSKMAEKLREITGLTAQSFAFLTNVTEDKPER
ncbi:MAG: DUF262 domain-containing protein [Steroidobacteraceae bacterium]